MSAEILSTLPSDTIKGVTLLEDRDAGDSWDLTKALDICGRGVTSQRLAPFQILKDAI